MTEQQNPTIAVKTVQQYRANNDDISDHDSKQMAANALRESFRSDQMTLDADPTPSPPVAVRLNADGTGWSLWDSPGKPDGQVITWTGTGTPATIDPDPLTGGSTTDGIYSVPLPTSITATGGPLRIQHDLGEPVTVTVFGTQGPMGYLFAQPITENVEHVEVMAGAVFIRVIPDSQVV
jgi:hypothetical protein